MRRKFRFDKLVRDGVATDALSRGETVEQHELSPDEFFVEAGKKFGEEGAEFGQAKTLEERKKELAGILQLAFDCVVVLDCSEEEVIAEMDKIHQEFGGFLTRTYIETVEMDEDNLWLPVMLESPDRYPEIPTAD